RHDALPICPQYTAQLGERILISGGRISREGGKSVGFRTEVCHLLQVALVVLSVFLHNEIAHCDCRKAGNQQKYGNRNSRTRLDCRKRASGFSFHLRTPTDSASCFLSPATKPSPLPLIPFPAYVGLITNSWPH